MSGTRVEVSVRPIEPRDLEEIRAELRRNWGSTEIWSLGHRHHADRLPGFVAEAEGAFAGLITLCPNEGGWQIEVVTLSARRRDAGVGAALLARAERFAREGGFRRIYLTTTNDNTAAMRFYQRRGWRLAALHAGIVDRVREIEPDYPKTGFDGIPIRDELELDRWFLDGSATA